MPRKAFYLSPLKVLKGCLSQIAGNGIEAARWGKTTSPILPLDLRPRLDLDSTRSHWRFETLPQCPLRQYHEAVAMVPSPEDILTSASREWLRCLVRWLLRITKSMEIAQCVNPDGSTRSTTQNHLRDEGDMVAPAWTTRRTMVDARYGNTRDGFVTILIEPLPLKDFLKVFRQPATKRESYIRAQHEGIYARAQFALHWTGDKQAALLLVSQDDCDMGEVVIKRSNKYYLDMKERAIALVECIEAGDEPMPLHDPKTHPDCENCSVYDECVSPTDKPYAMAVSDK